MIGLAGDGPVHIHLAEQAQRSGRLSELVRTPSRDLAHGCSSTSMITGVSCMRRTSTSTSSSASPPAVPRSAFARSPKPTWATASSRPRSSWLSRGSYGIGSDSNVLIDAAQELRVLEYSQRLALRARNRHDPRRWPLNRAIAFRLCAPWRFSSAGYSRTPESAPWPLPT